MRIGLVAHYQPEVVEFAQRAGFDALELYANPGTALDLETAPEARVRGLAADLRGRGLEVSGLTCSVNHLAGDPAERRRSQEYFLRAIRRTREFGARLLTTNPWADPDRSPAENLELYRESFTLYAREAEREGVLIALENCPHFTAYPYRVGSIGYSPEMWDALFDAVPSRAIGLELDPSHLLWLGVDVPRAIRDYGERIYSFHAKDCEIDREALHRCGVLGRQFGRKDNWDMGWWRYRIPGLGQLDWKEIAKALLDVGYGGPLVIEHEDPVFCGAPSELGLGLGEKTRAGLCWGLRFLRGLPL